MIIKEVLEKILGYRLEYYNPNELDMARRRAYKAEAKQIAESETFNNELNHLIATIVKNTVLHSESFNQVESARTSILQLEEFKNRLESVEDPDKVDAGTDEINEAI